MKFYNNSGNPRLTQFASGHQVEYVYTPSGQKVREIHRSPKSIVIGGMLPGPNEMVADTTDYIGPAIYRGGKPEMVRYAGGYASLSESGTKYVPAFHHYITDYLGNNRAVVRASDGAFVQVTYYYPWGSVYGDMGTGASLQPYKYGDKELDLTAGVARYDYSARAYYAAIPHFDRPDALAGKYPHISPYAFCANNPVNVTDPTGNAINMWAINESDKKFKKNTTLSTINDLIVITGLSVYLDGNTRLQYQKDDNGSPMIKQTVDKNGNSVDAGSKTARDFLMKVIDDKDVVDISYSNKSITDGPKNQIALNFDQIDSFVKGAVGVDGNTLGFGMTFLHELHHTKVGGGLKDDPDNWGTGPVVDNMNKIREELNNQGFNYGERTNYRGIQTDEGKIIPFNKSALGSLKNGLRMRKGDKYIRY